MAIDALVKPLLRVPILQGLRPLQVSEIARRAGRIVYQPGQTIIAQDSVGDAAVLICSGTAVRVVSADKSATEPGEDVPEGALVGEMAMLIETEHSATIVAKTTVRALRITRQDMHEQMAEDPDLADHFVQQIVKRLQALAGDLRRVDGMLADSIDTVAEAALRKPEPLRLAAPPAPTPAAAGIHH